LAAPACAAAQGFAQAVALGDAEVLIGESLNPAAPGFVHVYRKDGAGRWTVAQRLQASDAANNDHFGRTIVLAGGDLLVGATVARESGALYVFRKDASGSWREVQSLVPAGAHPDDSFGRAAATDGRTVVMSDWANNESRGAVYVFEKAGNTWRETAKLVSAEGRPNDWFGASVAIEGDLLAVGMIGRNEQRGAIQILRRGADGAWSVEGDIAPADLPRQSQFGTSVLIEGGSVLAGAPAGPEPAVRRYARGADGAWALAGEFKPEQPGTGFGASLAAVDGVVVVGAPGANQTGALYVLTDAGVEPAGNPPAADLGPGDGLGATIAARSDLAVAGVVNDDFGLGSALIFERPAGGEWTLAGRVFTEEETLAPITGGQVNCREGKASIFPCTDVNIVSFLPVKAIGGTRGIQLNDVWGWTDPVTGKEWAIVGRYDGTSFIDISDAAHPVYAGNLPLHAGARPNVWRDIKVYKDHAYVVSDGAGPHGVQVFDLTRLRGVTPAQMPATFTEDVHYDKVASAHNIVIDEASGFAFAVGSNSGGESCGGGLHMIDIREPKNPTFAGCFQDTRTGIQRTGYTHDAQCVKYTGPDADHRGKQICFGANETALSIADVTDKKNPVALASASYPNVAYAHQGWLDEQQEYFYMDDEGDESNGTVPRTRTLVWDVRDLDDPVLVKEHLGVSTAIDHNLYVRGNLMYQSNYNSGLRILDISDRTNPKEVGFIDTVPITDDPVFDGSWSNYPFFASGVIVVTSGREGVFFVRQAMRPVS
jgi:choice-of-anchor B domain-containing protein